MSLSSEETNLDMADVKQFAAIKFLQQVEEVREPPSKSENDEESSPLDESWSADASSASSSPSSSGSSSSGSSASSSSSAQRDPNAEPAWTKHPENEEERIAIERGKKLVMMFEDTPLQDIDPAWFLMTFPDHFPNGRGLPPERVSVIAWIKWLINIDGSLFQLDEFICAVGDWLLRHEVNLKAWLQFKVAPADFNRAQLAEEEDVIRVATILARRGRPKHTDSRVVHALYSQVFAVASRATADMFATRRFRRQVVAAWQHYGLFSMFFTINKMETRSPFSWRMAGADNELWHFPTQRNPQAPPDKDLEMINLVRRHPVVQNRFYEIGITTFREICCGFSKDGQYYQDYENGKPKGFFGPLDAVMLNREQSGRTAHHCHGQMISRVIKLHTFYSLMEQGAARVIRWMASISCMVMGDYVVGLRPDGVTPATIKPEALQGVPEGHLLQRIKRRPKSWLMSCEPPNLEHMDDAERQREMTEYMVCMKTALQIHEHTSRCIGKDPGAEGDDTDCDLGFRPGPPNEPVGRWEADTHQLYLPRDRTKMVACNEVLAISDMCNHNMVFAGDKSARMPNTDSEEPMEFDEDALQHTRYNTKYITKLDDLTGEMLILNLVAAQKRTAEEESDNPRMMIVRCVNAFHK